jgi:hypothetical protein
MKPPLPKFRRDIPHTKPARGYQGRSVGSVLNRIIAPTMRRRGFREVDILAHWPMIVGPQLAAMSCPERISRRGEGVVLTVRVEGAMALEVQHMSPLILERINQHYGSGAITKLNIIQGPLPLKPMKQHSRPPDVTELAEAEKSLGDIPEGRLKVALARLGARIARKTAEDEANTTS